MGNSLFEKGFFVVSVIILALISLILASMLNAAEYSWLILTPFAIFIVGILLVWNRLVLPERMLHLEDGMLVVYPNLLAILSGKGRYLEIENIERISLIDGYLAIYLLPISLNAVELWFPDNLTDEMQSYLRHNLPSIMVDRLITI